MMLVVNPIIQKRYLSTLDSKKNQKYDASTETGMSFEIWFSL